MSIPGRVEAAVLLRSIDPSPKFLRHSCAVADVAGWLAARIARNGIAVDRRLVEAAALLHDVDKALPRDDPARRLPHGEGSAEWLARQGHAELARAVANHPVSRLADDESDRGDPGGAAFATREERIVAYADKRAAQRLGPMAARFARWDRRHPDVWDTRTRGLVWARAERLEADVCRAAGIAPSGVARLRWTAAALREAARRSGT